jgi:hypothetical protein
VTNEARGTDVRRNYDPRARAERQDH